MMKQFALVLTTIALVIIPTSAQYVLGSGLYDDSSPVFLYGGTWQIESDVSHYQGAASNGAATDNAVLTIQMYGDGFTLFISRFPDGGNGIVCVDGICSNLSFYAAVQEYQVAIQYSGLATAQHEIEITADTGEIIFDAILIEPVSQPTATESPMPTDTPEFTETPTATPTLPPWVEYQVTDTAGNEQTVRYEYSTSAGDQLLGQIGFGLLVVGILLLVFQIWRYFHADS